MIINPYIIGNGGGSYEKPEIPYDGGLCFIDYNGTLLYSYTTAEAMALTALPANPTHTGLVSQGWNWTLAQIQDYLTHTPMGIVWVGQMYLTESGETEIDVDLPDYLLNVNLTIAVNGTATINWGDGSTLETVTGTSLTKSLNFPHTYTNPGKYTIKIDVLSGLAAFHNGGSGYAILMGMAVTSINHVRIGSNFYLYGRAFQYCANLETVTIPSGTVFSNGRTFQDCKSLVSVTSPIGRGALFSDNECNGDWGLENVSFPPEVNNMWGSEFYDCKSLAFITFPVIVNFNNKANFLSASGVRSLIFPYGTTMIPQNVAKNCPRLTHVHIPETVTEIASEAFYGCNKLSYLDIPASVTSIGTNAFYNCTGMVEYHFRSITPPMLGNTSVFNQIPSSCVIYVPQGSLAAYQAATNWSTYASHMQEEPA